MAKTTKQHRYPRRVARALAGPRQWRYPKEFRIPPSVWDEAWLLALEGLADALASEAQPQDRPPAEQPASTEQLHMFANVGTGLWRLRRQLVQPDTDEPRDEMRRAYRHFEAVWDALALVGIEIQDHTGAFFHTGMALAPILFQPTPGLIREQVLETVRPSIYLNGQLIQMGEVIVGTPAAAEDKSQASPSE